MSRVAIHFVIPGGKYTGAARESPVDLPHHGDHLARHLFLGIGVAREIALRVTIHALDSQRLIEVLHDEANVSVRRQQLQVLRSRWRTRPTAAGLLAE